MFFGYNTNGLAHHSTLDGIALIGEMGYESVALSLDHHCLPPPDYPQFSPSREQVAETLQKYQLRCVLETGARFLLNPAQKHAPALTEEDADKRLDFLRHAIDTAAFLGAEVVTLFAGKLPQNLPKKTALERLTERLSALTDEATTKKVTLALEPEPGMLIARVNDYEQLLANANGKLDKLMLTADLGHLFCQREPFAETLSRVKERLVNIHLADSCYDEHKHLQCGEGEMNFPEIFEVLRKIGYRQGVYVELSRHSHLAPLAAYEALQFLRNC